MDKTLHDLGRILLNAVPTLLIVSFLILFLRGVFFGPMKRILRRRWEETEGARRAAEESMRQAEAKVAEYEEKLRAARGDLYAEQDKALRQLESEHAHAMEIAKREADARLVSARAQLTADVESARRRLESESGDIADRIVARVLQGRVA